MRIWDVDVWSGCPPPLLLHAATFLLRPYDTRSKGKFDFNDDVWTAVSADAKDMIKQLLVVDPAKRLTLEQVDERWSRLLSAVVCVSRLLLRAPARTSWAVQCAERYARCSASCLGFINPPPPGLPARRCSSTPGARRQPATSRSCSRCALSCVA